MRGKEELGCGIAAQPMNLPSIRSVFHPTDFSLGDETALIHALRIAVAARSSLELMHVGAEGEEVHWSDFPSIRSHLAQWGLVPQEASAADVIEAGVRPIKIRRHGTDPAEEIAAHVDRVKPDLVVLSTHQRHGLQRTLHPSHAERVARASRSQTLFVPRGFPGFVDSDTGQAHLLQVLIPLDHRPFAQIAINAAASLATQLDCKGVHWVGLHIGSSPRFPKVTLPSGPGWSSEFKLWDGPVVERILETASAIDASLIVMPTAGHHGFLDAIRGSTTERVLQACRCPLLAVNMAAENHGSESVE